MSQRANGIKHLLITEQRSCTYGKEYVAFVRIWSRFGLHNLSQYKCVFIARILYAIVFYSLETELIVAYLYL